MKEVGRGYSQCAATSSEVWGLVER